MSYRTAPSDTKGMPSGIPYIIGNEAAERFSFYGMKAALVIFMTQYLHLMGDRALDPMNEAQATEYTHYFNAAVYLTPLLGAFICDLLWGKYSTIMRLSVVYCLGHAALALMGVAGPASWWLVIGLGLIAVGAGGIKPCVSAHVGDQFGKNNQHLLTQVFNWFYFSINLGAAISNIMIPWVLEWYGPHLAFGIPGVLMAIATLLFWMGRRDFAHIPPAGKRFLKDIFCSSGLKVLGKVSAIFLFVAVFWALFDQTATTWVLQARDMDTNLFGIEILPSQVQSANPIFILVLIPLFTYVIYPFVEKFVPLTPLRKIGAGLFLTALAFALSALIQEWIDAGESPNILWQIWAYLLLTSAEIMVSIVCLEFAYTQSPKSMKSMVMSLFLLSVFFGNTIAGLVNRYIQVESPLKSEAKEAYIALNNEKADASQHRKEWKKLHYAGFDKKEGTADDIVTHFNEKGVITKRDVPAEDTLIAAAARIEQHSSNHSKKFPTTEEGQKLIADIKDPWGNPLNYRLMNSQQCRITSFGPDKEELTKWDTGILINLKQQASEKKKEKKTWLEKRREQLGIKETGEKPFYESKDYSRQFIAGGLYRMEGATYFWFFTLLMAATTIIFIPVAIFYKPTVIDEEDIPDEEVSTEVH